MSNSQAPAGSTCGDWWIHRFAWGGLTDDHTQPVDLVSRIEPVTVGAPALGDGESLSVEESMCSDGDPTLKSNFHRAYEV